MISYKVAGNEHFNELLDIVYHQEVQYLNPILDLIQLTSDQFGRLFRSTGTVYRILENGRLAGLCWVEVCGRVLLLHSLVMRPSFRGRGLGTRTLEWLEDQYQGAVDEIELRVHRSNPRARALYQRCGYQASPAPGPSGFYNMRKKL
jgi:GNAT superfamily N-acetyltransferase